MAYNRSHRKDSFLEEDEAKEESVFMDKYRLSFNILEQEGILIQQYNNILRSMKAGYYDNKTITASYEFLDCWTTLKGLYDFLEFNKLTKWDGTHDKEKKGKKKEKEEDYKKNKEDCQKLKLLMKDYINNKNLSLQNLSEAYNLLRKFIALSGYHEDTYKDKGGTLGEEED